MCKRSTRHMACIYMQSKWQKFEPLEVIPALIIQIVTNFLWPNSMSRSPRRYLLYSKFSDGPGLHTGCIRSHFGCDSTTERQEHSSQRRARATRHPASPGIARALHLPHLLLPQRRMELKMIWSSARSALPAAPPPSRSHTHTPPLFFRRV